jgi:hypothetical protein
VCQEEFDGFPARGKPAFHVPSGHTREDEMSSVVSIREHDVVEVQNLGSCGGKVLHFGNVLVWCGKINGNIWLYFHEIGARFGFKIFLHFVFYKK